MFMMFIYAIHAYSMNTTHIYTEIIARTFIYPRWVSLRAKAKLDRRTGIECLFVLLQRTLSDVTTCFYACIVCTSYPIYAYIFGSQPCAGIRLAGINFDFASLIVQTRSGHLVDILLIRAMSSEKWEIQIFTTDALASAVVRHISVAVVVVVALIVVRHTLFRFCCHFHCECCSPGERRSYVRCAWHSYCA